MHIVYNNSLNLAGHGFDTVKVSHMGSKCRNKVVRYRPVKKPWITTEVLNLRDKRRELKKKPNNT
ncbi:hypothetical protein CHS0354_013952 [Potamilus streckersoni]|uniref:Uncharacterized protein n=1 Tax=Potamilus streckersoni TaxID=2493646 RepID=A0AAE0RWV6_9BIVA|nr:hypothetical protein CHS0354_013952 [Potamilus streckersoni]